MAHELYFLTGKALGRLGGLTDSVCVVKTEKDRDDVLFAARSHGDNAMRAISRDEAFEVVQPDANGLRRFLHYGSAEPVQLRADWSPEHVEESIIANDRAMEVRHNEQDAAWIQRFKN